MERQDMNRRGQRGMRGEKRAKKRRGQGGKRGLIRIRSKGKGQEGHVQ